MLICLACQGRRWVWLGKLVSVAVTGAYSNLHTLTNCCLILANATSTFCGPASFSRLSTALPRLPPSADDGRPPGRRSDRFLKFGASTLALRGLCTEPVLFGSTVVLPPLLCLVIFRRLNSLGDGGCDKLRDSGPLKSRRWRRILSGISRRGSVAEAAINDQLTIYTYREFLRCIAPFSHS